MCMNIEVGVNRFDNIAQWIMHACGFVTGSAPTTWNNAVIWLGCTHYSCNKTNPNIGLKPDLPPAAGRVPPNTNGYDSTYTATKHCKYQSY